ncbi:MAG: PTS sugar transporter subunit IIA [Candidatus Hydrogenedentes bacterium]|nr:PTS sugar transporter subunit IIA [Candidatus Hydrogenedentota bacterium]
MSVFGVEVNPDHICIIPRGTSKADALDQLIDALGHSDAIIDTEAFRRAVHEREAVMSTGIGGGIAIPHVRIPQVKRPIIGVGIAPHGLEFKTLDKKPVFILVLFATPEGADKEYLGLLAKVMMALKNTDYYEKLVACKTPEAAHAVLTS